jgi:hypothetical protein
MSMQRAMKPAQVRADEGSKIHFPRSGREETVLGSFQKLMSDGVRE